MAANGLAQIGGGLPLGGASEGLAHVLGREDLAQADAQPAIVGLAHGLHLLAVPLFLLLLGATVRVAGHAPHEVAIPAEAMDVERVLRGGPSDVAGQREEPAAFGLAFGMVSGCVRDGSPVGGLVPFLGEPLEARRHVVQVEGREATLVVGVVGRVGHQLVEGAAAGITAHELADGQLHGLLRDVERGRRERGQSADGVADDGPRQVGVVVERRHVLERRTGPHGHTPVDRTGEALPVGRSKPGVNARPVGKLHQERAPLMTFWSILHGRLRGRLIGRSVEHGRLFFVGSSVSRNGDGPSRRSAGDSGPCRCAASSWRSPQR